MAERIMLTSDPQKCNKIGMLPLKDFDSFLWDRQSRIIVKRGVKAKLSQNIILRNNLLETQNALIALCSPSDNKWGIGIGIDDPDYKRVDNWTGQNWLGTILMEVRDELRHEDLLYSDACDLGLIREWTMTAGELGKIPSFSQAVNAYIETIKDPNVRQIICNDYLLCEVEESLKTNSNHLLPRNGFFEMKQDVYDTVRHLNLYDEEEPLKWLLEDNPEALKEPNLIKPLLAKYYPGDRRKKTLLYFASEKNVPQQIVETEHLTQTKKEEMANRLVESYGCMQEYALEAVEIWAEALGIIEPKRTYDESNHPGKEKCNTLRDIRKKIAEANNIKYEPAECHHTGPCSGTCPVCDEEIRYLNEEIKKKTDRGEEIFVFYLAPDDLKMVGFHIENEENFFYIDDLLFGSDSDSKDGSDDCEVTVGSSFPLEGL